MLGLIGVNFIQGVEIRILEVWRKYIYIYIMNLLETDGRRSSNQEFLELPIRCH
jgi:hypothetical protein